MTQEQQRKADHLALVAAPMFVAYRSADRYDDNNTDTKLVEYALRDAELLQKAAEERVKHE